MKHILSIIIFLALSSYSCFATNRALVIGIGNYPAETGWDPINGDKDIPIVREMLSKNGFQEQNIVELKNEQATAAGIRSAFATLIASAKAGDVVYIHFSGHGQRVTDLQGEEQDHFDEAWIPYDAQLVYKKGIYEGKNHIIDDELNIWLTQLRAKVGAKGKITVVADACHSGGGSRATEEESTCVIRGTSDDFIIPIQPKVYTGEIGIVDWIFISACKSNQCNYEYNGMGSLTYALSIKGSDLSRISYSEVHRSIRSTIREVVLMTQTPVIETPTVSTQTSLF